MVVIGIYYYHHYANLIETLINVRINFTTGTGRRSGINNKCI